MGRKQVKCHGDDTRFDEIADFIYSRYGNTVKYIADVAGGQGLLSKILNKKYNYISEVIDPREYQGNSRQRHGSFEVCVMEFFQERQQNRLVSVRAARRGRFRRDRD